MLLIVLSPGSDKYFLAIFSGASERNFSEAFFSVKNTILQLEDGRAGQGKDANPSAE